MGWSDFSDENMVEELNLLGTNSRRSYDFFFLNNKYYKEEYNLHRAFLYNHRLHRSEKQRGTSFECDLSQLVLGWNQNLTTTIAHLAYFLEDVPFPITSDDLP